MTDTPQAYLALFNHARDFLKSYYETQHRLAQSRLDNFELVNWPGLKKQFALHLSEDPQLLEDKHHTLTFLIQWLEDTLTD
ncbi:MAG: hypothetical protein KTR14_06955 [Vampirovibrio sp.]|nr:hypothetical protein [Vampirovibrio sp.]